MSKKHFIALADALRPAWNRGELKESDPLLHEIMAFCRQQNSNFMPDRWLGYLKGTNGKNGGKK